MDGSETPIQATRIPDRGAPPGAFQGVVLGVKRENGAQTVDIQGAQGRIRLQAEGEFQVGEKLRVLVQPGGAVRLEKASVPAGPAQDWGRGYQMPGNLAALNSVRDFEGRLANWIAGRQPGAAAGGAPPAGTASPAANPLPAGGLNGLAQALGGEAGALLRLPLPELLKRVLAREGGRDMLAQALAALGRDAFASLTAGLEDGGGESSTSSLLALLRGLRRQLPGEGGPGSAGLSGAGGMATAARASGPGAMGAFWPAVAAGGPGTATVGPGGSGIPAGGSAAAGALFAAPGAPGASHGPAGAAGMPWMGRVLERQDTAGTLAFAGGAPLPARGAADPMYRYLLDLGSRTLEVQSPQLRDPGEFVDFEMEAQGARMQARFLDPARSLPEGLRSGFAGEPPEMRAALQVAARSLADFAGEPYFDDLVRDFGQVLAQSGRLALPDGAARLPPGQLPGPRDIDGLLRLFVAFPRDAEQPEAQARAWGEAVRDPKALAGLLRALKPEVETSLLRAGTPLRAAAGGVPADPALSQPAPAGAAGNAGAAAKDDAMVALLRRLLPDGFKPGDLIELARGHAPAAEGKEGKTAHFSLQAFSGLVPREEEMREGRPNTFYFYQDQDWKGLQITWERESRKESRRRRDPEAPLKVRVETDARHMGKVDVALTLKGDDAYLHFRNQFHDVQEILAANMPELRKSAALLGVHIESWTYAPLEDLPQVPPTAGWVRPASLDAGLLDLMG